MTEEIKKIKIRVVGIGGGGGSIVSEIASKIKRVTFFAANTHLQALKEINKKVKPFPFGQNLTHGLGTGMNPQLGEMAALNEKERIKNLFKNQDLIILIACLGGGTGSGATPVFAKMAKNEGCLTYGIFTLPFKFEGKKKMRIARESLEKLRPKLNIFSIIPNERIFQIVDRSTPLRESLSTINKALAQSLEGLLEVIYSPGLINIDFADLKTILEGEGKWAYLNSVTVGKKEGIKKCLEAALNSPFYPYSIQGAKGILYNIAGEKDLNLEEMGQISKNIAQFVHPDAKIIFGISEGKKYRNVIKTTIFASDLPIEIFQKRKKPQKEEKAPPPKERKVKKTEIKIKKAEDSKMGKEVLRKNALQVKKEAEEVEREIIEKEKFWETPAFLRKKFMLK